MPGHLVDERSEPAGDVDAAARLDLDDVGAEVGELHRPERAGPHPRHVDDAQPGQRGVGTRLAGPRRGGAASRSRPACWPIAGTSRRAGGSTPAMRIGDAGADHRTARADHAARGTSGGRAAAPTPSRRRARGRGTPARPTRGPWRGTRRRVMSATASRRASRRRRTARRAGRWSRTRRGGPTRDRRASSRAPATGRPRCTARGRSRRGSRRCPTGTRRASPPATGTSPAYVTVGSTVAIVVTIASRAATSMRWPRPSRNRAWSAPTTAIAAWQRGEHLGQLAAQADRAAAGRRPGSSRAPTASRSRRAP